MFNNKNILDKAASEEHRHFIKKQIKTTRLITFARYAILIIFIAIWELLTHLDVLDPFIFSSPFRILKTTIQLLSTGQLFNNIAVTLYETIVGFTVATVAGTGIAIALWWFPSAAKTLDPYLVILNSLPKIALGPILIVWLGSGMGTIIAIAVLVSIVITITNVLSGLCAVSKEKQMLMRSLGATKAQTLYMMVFPANIPTIVSTLKLNVGMAWVGVIVGEFLVSRAGLGYLAVYGGQIFKLDLVMTSVTILCILAAVMYYIVAWFEKIVTKRTA